MSSGQDARSLLCRVFPGHEATIERALRDHASFRELCEDYRKCASAFERWRGLDGDGPASRSREYRELLAELARELKTWLDDMEGAPGRPLGDDSR